MIKIDAIPAFTDNYIWCLIDEQSNKAVVVDPGEAAPVTAALAQKQLHLSGIIITHHHFDHTGGIDELLALAGNIPVFGPKNPQIPQITHTLTDREQVEILGLRFEVITIPGHTLDHIAFYSDTLPDHPILFCGDTLFAGGCGRVFEGDAPMMLTSLSKLAHLPSNTVFYCAHEYTLANLEFAMAVEPNNETLKARFVSDTQRREQGLATVPSTLDIEKKTNPFLRCEEIDVINAATLRLDQSPTSAADVFAAIRGWKDNF